MYDRVLVPTDGSEDAERAADRGLDLAAALEADVAALSVVESGPLGDRRLPGEPASAEQVLADQAEEFVSRIERRARDRGLPVTTAVRSGVPEKEIREYAAEIGADVVVMGPRGRGGLDRLVLGSVTDDVARHGDVDVLVVDGAGDEGDSRAETEDAGDRSKRE